MAQPAITGTRTFTGAPSGGGGSVMWLGQWATSGNNAVSFTADGTSNYLAAITIFVVPSSATLYYCVGLDGVPLSGSYFRSTLSTTYTAPVLWACTTSPPSAGSHEVELLTSTDLSTWVTAGEDRGSIAIWQGTVAYNLNLGG